MDQKLKIKFETLSHLFKHWNEAQDSLAEKLDKEGDRVWENLKEEYLDRFLVNSNTDITEQGNPKNIEKTQSGMGPSTSFGI